MHRINVNTVSTMEGCCSATEESNTDQLQKGQVVEGVITKVSDTISITLNGKELQVSQSAVQNAKEGQVRTFEIKDISKQSIVLREVGNETEPAVSQGIKQTSVASGTAAFVGSIKDSKQSESLEQAKEKVKQQISTIVSRLSESDYREMDQEATPLEEYNEDRFERMLSRIKEQKQFKREHLKQEIEKKQETREEIEDSTKDIKKRLEEQDLPATDENIAKVASAMELAAMCGQMTDASKAYLIDQNLPVTPENIYKSIYSGNAAGSGHIAEETWNELKPQVEELLEKEGLAADEKVLSEAKWLFGNRLTISKETIATLEQLNALTKENDPAVMMDLILKNLSEGGEPKATNLPEQSADLICMQKAADAVTMLQEIKDQAVDAVEEGEALTLEALHQASKEIGTENASAMDIKAITARRQLEEVRLKLTLQSSYQLYKQGIQVNTTELSKLVEELRALEDDYYKGLSEELGFQTDKDERGLLKATDQMVAGLKGMPAAILGSTFSKRDSITMAELYGEGEKKQAALVNKASEYETLMTAPRKDLGDSIKKAFAHVGNLLEDLQMEQSESNERAVRILAYNQMEITEASITEMKSYDLKVNQLMQAMTPEVALTLIKQGKNPMDLPVQEVTEAAQKIASSIGETSEEKFSEYLYHLDRKNGISSEERESYIGIYRLLHQVEKSDGAAVGAVVKANQELTLGNLLTAVRSKKQSGMDIEVDHKHGGVDRVQTSQASISEQVNKAFYGKQLVKEAFDGLSTDALDALGKEPEDLLTTSLEELCETEREISKESSSDYTAQKYENLRKVLSTSVQSEVLVYAGVDVTANQLEAASYLLPGGSTIYKDMRDKVSQAGVKLKEQTEALYEAFYERLGSEESLEEGYAQLSDTVTEAFEQYMNMEGVTAEDAGAFRIYQNVIRLAGNLSRSRMFEIPVTLGEEVVTMKVQMVSSSDATSKVSIHMEDERMGAFDMTATVEDGGLSAFLVCDNRMVTEYYDTNKEQIIKELEQTGLHVKQLAVTMNRKKTDFYDTTTVNTQTTISTEVLYKVAKIFVANTKRAFE